MNEKIKYLNIFVLLTFLVGQVQYVYSIYFCTMEHKTVQRPTMETSCSTDNDGDLCEACQGVIPQQHGQQIIETNCIKVISVEKSMVDNFTSLQKYVQHFVSIAFIGNQLDALTSQLSTINYEPLPLTDSPPLDLPTLNSNLRI